MEKAMPHPRPSTPHKSYHSKTVVIQDSPSDSFSDSDNFSWFFKLQEPSSNSEEDEWRGQSSTIGLVSDYPNVTVHVGKRFKALIDSGAVISLAYTSVHLKTVDRSWMGKATLCLHIADFKFSHTFIICDKLPETDILVGIDIQKKYSLSYCWDSDKQLFIQRKGSFLTYTRNCEQQHNIAEVKSPLKTT